MSRLTINTITAEIKIIFYFLSLFIIDLMSSYEVARIGSTVWEGQIFGLIRASASHLHTMLVACFGQQRVGGD